MDATIARERRRGYDYRTEGVAFMSIAYVNMTLLSVESVDRSAVA